MLSIELSEFEDDVELALFEWTNTPSKFNENTRKRQATSVELTKTLTDVSKGLLF